LDRNSHVVMRTHTQVKQVARPAYDIHKGYCNDSLRSIYSMKGDVRQRTAAICDVRFPLVKTYVDRLRVPDTTQKATMITTGHARQGHTKEMRTVSTGANRCSAQRPQKMCQNVAHSGERGTNSETKTSYHAVAAGRSWMRCGEGKRLPVVVVLGNVSGNCDMGRVLKKEKDLWGFWAEETWSPTKNRDRSSAALVQWNKRQCSDSGAT